ncbi:MAG TPA: hypothetical protein VIU45_03605 [Chitinophagaceae bacterium]
MRKKLIQQFFSLFVAITFFFATTPHDFIHLFAGHKDTIDHYYPGKTELSNKHIHCEFLRIAIATFVSSAEYHLVCLEQHFQELSVIIPVSYYFNLPRTSYLRGPPAFC